ncbi:uncharacterized protein LOC134710404 [Mytilus trossulus]|uniref:uncharacterized protein LOC134710404 n=1 Tax=Mytilus trossulus TaxID=6551 RepID=UPI003006F2A5
MASLSIEEENYVRMSLLLTGISPRAARNFFDREFAPTCLDASLKKEYSKLLDLKKEHRINQLQWNLMFPRFPDAPNSQAFDITLIITLLRNLTTITRPHRGFDTLPTASETTPGADLARIKYYRNYLAHLDDGKVESTVFNTAWDIISEAVGRLGGQNMKGECDLLRTKILDQTNREIMMDIKRSNDEIKELKESFASLKRSHDELQVDHAEMTKEVKRLKHLQVDTVPWNIRERIDDTLKVWKDNNDKMFINTRAAQTVLKSIKENSCVTIIASSGVGKTCILRQTALKMAEENYDVLLVTDPSDIVKFYNPHKKSLFVVDDLCGNFSVNQSDIKRWEPVMENIKQILEKQQAKIIAACRLQVYQDEKFESLSVFKSCACNLLSENVCLSETEKQSIAEIYLKTKASEITDYYSLYDCFPLLCKLYHDNPILNVKNFFQNPFSVYEAEIDQLLKKGHHTKFCALALCVIFNNKLKEEMLTEEVDEETMTIIENTCEACRLDRGTSRLVLQDELDSLEDTFIKKENSIYKIIHDKIFDFLTFFYGQKIITCLIRNADSCLIKERFSLEKSDCLDQFISVIPQKYLQMYKERLINDWSKGKVQDVFSNLNMKKPLFREQLLLHLKTLDISYQRQLAHICNKPNQEDNDDDNEYDYDCMYCFDDDDWGHDEDYDGHSDNVDDDDDDDDEDDDDNDDVDNVEDDIISNCCFIGDISLVLWCCDHGVDINKGTCYNGESPLMKACKGGHTAIVKMLLDRGANFDKCDTFDQTPLMKACEHGHTVIAKMLVNRGADYDKCNNTGQFHVMKACQHGHLEIVKMLIDNGADCNKCNSVGQSPVMKACQHGHFEIVKMLVNRGADYDKCDKNGQSPVMKACKYGHLGIVKLLIDNGTDFNKCNNLGQSPVMMACEHGHTEIAKILISRGADFNKCNNGGQSPLMKACQHGHLEIVKMLISRGADYNKCDSDGQFPLMKACENGHIEIVKLLLERGAYFNVCDNDGESTVLKACKNGHKEVVMMLIDRGADYRKCDNWGESPVMKACEQGHIGIVKILIDREADFNKCDCFGQTPLITACENGHVEIVKLLLDKGTDFNLCDYNCRSTFMKTCKREVVMAFVRGADDHICGNWGESPVMKACAQGHTKIVEMLLEKGADYNKYDGCGETPLMKACKNGHTDILKILLNRGADYINCDGYGETPVMKASEYGHSDTLNILLDKGAGYNTCDGMTETLIMKACENGHTNTLKILLDRGEDCNKCNGIGRTPAMLACQRGHKEIVKILLERGADFNKRDIDGYGAASIANDQGYPEIVDLIYEK